ncbi:MAG: type II secretion system F family protein [Candidatus Diapherotrites archaeon]|nr:type II secretion system F family protein [Candidatus Diapherotrites archaeon]
MDANVFFKRAILFFFEKNRVKNFEEKLFMNNSKMKSLTGFIEYSLVEGIFLMIAAMALGAKFFGTASIALGPFAFFLPFALNYLFQDIKFEKRKLAKEKLLPDLLLEASVFCDETSFIGTIKRLAKQDFPLLREDFERAAAEISNGASAEEALERMKALNKSEAYSRVIGLLLQGYHSGAEMSKIFKETAEDLLETHAILRERQAVMLVNKYTLILASGIIVPAVIGLIVGLVSGLNFDSMGELSLGLSIETRKKMLSFATLGTTIYLGEYALLSSFFLALQEGNKKQFWVYALILLPTALGVFYFAKGL